MPIKNNQEIGPLCHCGHGMFEHSVSGATNEMRCSGRHDCDCHQFVAAESPEECAIRVMRAQRAQIKTLGHEIARKQDRAKNALADPYV